MRDIFEIIYDEIDDIVFDSDFIQDDELDEIIMEDEIFNE